jgi:drug/metabolite transporter (DMT)-like permease
MLLALGVLTALAQYLLAAGYKIADATYLQPFGDLMVPLSAVLGWLILGQVPSPWFWLGAALILGASLFIFYVEAGRRRGPTPTLRVSGVGA